MRAVYVLCVLGLLAGCTTPLQDAKNVCSDRGLNPGNGQWDACVSREHARIERELEEAWARVEADLEQDYEEERVPWRYSARRGLEPRSDHLLADPR